MRRKNTTKQRMKEYMMESLLILLRKKRYGKISIREITERAGVNRSTYYRNFKSKDEIIAFFYEKIIVQSLREDPHQSQETLEDYLCTMFQHFYQYKEPLLLLYENGLSHLLLNALDGLSERRAFDALSSSQEQFKVFFHMGGIYHFFTLWFQHDMAESPEELVEISLSILPDNARPMLGMAL